MIPPAEATYAPLPLPGERFRGLRVTAIGTGALITLGVLAIWLGFFDEPAAFGVAVALVLVPLGVWYWWRLRKHNRRMQAAAARVREQARSTGEMVTALDKAHGALWRQQRWTWEQFEQARQERGLPRVRAIVDTSIGPAVRSVELTDALLEPESIIVTHAVGRRPQTVFFGFSALLCAAYSVGRAMRGDWFFAVFFLILAGFFVISMPALRGATFTGSARWPVAAVGSVKVFDGRLWTVDAAILLVSPTISSGLHVRLVGPAGWLAMTFMGPDDENFLTLWRRWMHPAARPELLELL